MIKPKHKQNSLLEYEEQFLEVEDRNSEAQIEKSIRWLTQLWEELGIERIPSKEDILSPTNRELEAVLIIRKYGN